MVIMGLCLIQSLAILYCLMKLNQILSNQNMIIKNVRYIPVFPFYALVD